MKLAKQIFAMPLILEQRTNSTVPVELAGITPDWAQGKSLAEIERTEVLYGRRKIPLAELFRVRGNADDLQIDLQGILANVHRIGEQMTSGKIRIAGSTGRHVGSGMRGGSIEILGNAGDWLGAEMHGGQIWVNGDAGNQVGAAYRGATKGMRGGSILVEGNAGHENGLRMRRGMIAIGGDAGEMAGANMIAGTLLVFGTCGKRAGAEMRRGSIVLVGNNPPSLLPTFRHAGTMRLQFFSLLANWLACKGWQEQAVQLDRKWHQFHGDALTLGKGEIFTR